MTRETKHWMDEPGIGSGKKDQGQKDIGAVGASSDAMLSRQESTVGSSGTREDQSNGRVLRSGTHLARIAAVLQDDGTWEAQVYVRLMREPELAETYIPVGLFPTEGEALTAAEQRAQRAFNENEF